MEERNSPNPTSEATGQGIPPPQPPPRKRRRLKIALLIAAGLVLVPFAILAWLEFDMSLQERAYCKHLAERIAQYEASRTPLADADNAAPLYEEAFRLNVGLFETPKGFSAYLVGADSYDEEDSDWACAESFTPKERYFKIPRGGFKDWKQVQAVVAAAVRIFLNSAAGKISFLAKAQAVTVGFDDGDLVCVQRSGFETAE